MLPQRGRGRLTRRVALPVWMLAALLVALAGLAAATAVLAVSGDDGTVRVARPTGGASVPGHPLRDPFVADGARWAAFLDPNQPWTAVAHTTSAGDGRRWVLVAVRVRNLRRDVVDVSRLGARLRTGDGRVVAPDRGIGTGAPSRRRAVRVGRGRTGQAELAFSVPASAAPALLTFETRARRGATVTIRLR